MLSKVLLTYKDLSVSSRACMKELVMVTHVCNPRAREIEVVLLVILQIYFLSSRP